MPDSKHKKRRQRRALYYAELDNAVNNEPRFVNRAIDTLDHDGVDYSTPDGKPIKADFRRYIKTRRKSKPLIAAACMDLLERAVRRISVDPRRPSIHRRD